VTDPLLTGIIERVRDRIGLNDPAQVELLARLATDATQLGAQAAAGVDVSRELAIVKASAENLDVAVRRVLGEELFITGVGTLIRVIGAAAG